MDGMRLARVLRNRFDYSEALWSNGLVGESDDIRRQILSVMNGDMLRSAVLTGGNERYAIAGDLPTWEDMMRSTTSGAVGGAVGGAAAGAGIGAIPGAIGGAIGGFVSQPFGAFTYHWRGKSSRAETQGKDLSSATSKLAGILSQLGAPEAGAQIRAIGQEIQQKIQVVRTQKYNELSKQYGLSGDDASVWQHLKENVSHPLSYIGRAVNMAQASLKPDGMERISNDQSVWVDPGNLLDNWISPGIAKSMPSAVGKGVSNLSMGNALKGGALGMGGYVATDYAWGAISDRMKGQMVVMQNLASDIGKQLAEIAGQMQDPTYLQYGQMIQQVVAQVMPQLSQKIQSGMMQRSRKYPQQPFPQQQPQSQPQPAQQMFSTPYPTADQVPVVV